RASAARIFGTRTLLHVAMSATVAGPKAPRYRRTTSSYAVSGFGGFRSLAGGATCRATFRCSKRAPDDSQIRPLVATAAHFNQLRSLSFVLALGGRCAAVNSSISPRVRGVFAAKVMTRLCSTPRSASAGAPGGRHAPKRPSIVAREYAGYSRADTRCRVARMSVAFTISPRSMGAVSCARSNPERRDQSATYGDGAH